MISEKWTQFARQELCFRMRIDIETGFRSGNGHRNGKKILLTMFWKTGFTRTNITRHASVATIMWRMVFSHAAGNCPSMRPSVWMAITAPAQIPLACSGRQIRTSSAKSPNIAMAVQGDAFNPRITEMASRSELLA